jgi:alpha-1,3-rhamnosyltransferase
MKNPLVTIVVITYNSSKYVLKTLESVKVQNYQNIELIITDDASTDNTVEICRNWLKTNKKRFYNSELIINSTNTGVALNCNRGLAVAKGEWLKYVAGDDLMQEDAIAINMDYISSHSLANVIISDKILINAKDEIISHYKHNNHSIFNNPRILYNELLKGSSLISPITSFFRTKFLNKIGGFDDKIPMIEDYPLWLKISKNGYPIDYIEKYTMFYRIHNDSIMGSTDRNKVNVRFLNDKKKFYEHYIEKELIKKRKIFRLFSIYIEKYIINLQLKKDNYYNIKKHIRFLDIYYLIRIIKKKFSFNFFNKHSYDVFF